MREIWKAHVLSSHRWRQFKLPNERAFAEKLHDVVGLHISPPAHAVVLSVDEKSQIQALDRTQPGLPLKKGRGPTMTHDYKRNGTTRLFAALNELDGSVIGQNMQRHRHQEFIRFLNRIEQDVPEGKSIHVILDNYCTLKHAKVRAWLAGHPPFRPDTETVADQQHAPSHACKHALPGNRSSVRNRPMVGPCGYRNQPDILECRSIDRSR